MFDERNAFYGVPVRLEQLLPTYTQSHIPNRRIASRDHWLSYAS
jgi:hypothetical protein